MKSLKKLAILIMSISFVSFGIGGLDSLNDKYTQNDGKNIVVQVVESGMQNVGDILVPSAKAQCARSPSILGQGPQGGSPCWGGNSNSNNNNGNQIMIPQGIQVGQPFNTVVNGQNMRCTLKDRAATGVLYGAAGAAAGAAIAHIAKLFKADVSANRAATAGALAGASAGATLMCDPEMVDDNDAVRQVQVASAQQTVRNQTCRDPAESPFRLNLPSHPKHNQVVCMRPDDPNRARDY